MALGSSVPQTWMSQCTGTIIHVVRDHFQVFWEQGACSILVLILPYMQTHLSACQALFNWSAFSMFLFTHITFMSMNRDSHPRCFPVSFWQSFVCLKTCLCPHGRYSSTKSAIVTVKHFMVSLLIQRMILFFQSGPGNIFAMSKDKAKVTGALHTLNEKRNHMA